MREVDRKIADLTALRRKLNAAIATCMGATLAKLPDSRSARSRIRFAPPWLTARCSRKRWVRFA